MSLYKKAKLHKGKMVNCKVCMKHVAELDPEYALRVSKIAAAEDKFNRKRT